MVKNKKQGLTKFNPCDTIDLTKEREVIKMLEMLNTIPNEIGWVIVGVSGTMCAMMMFKLCGLFSKMIQMRFEDEEGEE